MTFAGKHVLITGGTGALGAAVCITLIRQGAHCIVPYPSEHEAEHFVHRNDSNVTLVKAGDLSDETVVEALYRDRTLWASIHLAGGFALGSVEDTSKVALMQQIDGNLVSCFLCCRAAVRAMKTTGGGRIVNVAARPALEPRSGAGMSAYTIAKSGVATLSIALAEEVTQDGILVNAVAPSIMDTPANRKAMPKANLDNWPKLEDVAATIVYLASPQNTVGRGGIVPVYGKS